MNTIHVLGLKQEQLVMTFMSTLGDLERGCQLGLHPPADVLDLPPDREDRNQEPEASGRRPS